MIAAAIRHLRTRLVAAVDGGANALRAGFDFEPRGEIIVKSKRAVEAFFLIGPRSV